MRNGAVFGERLPFFVAPRSQTERAILVAQEDIAALRAGEPQQRVYQRDQDIAQHPAGVQLARRFQIQREHLQVGNILRRPPVADAAQEIARRSGCFRVGAEQQVSFAAHPKLDAVVGLQLVPVHPLAVDVGAVLAVLVL